MCYRKAKEPFAWHTYHYQGKITPSLICAQVNGRWPKDNIATHPALGMRTSADSLTLLNSRLRENVPEPIRLGMYDKTKKSCCTGTKLVDASLIIL